VFYAFFFWYNYVIKYQCIKVNFVSGMDCQCSGKPARLLPMPALFQNVLGETVSLKLSVFHTLLNHQDIAFSVSLVPQLTIHLAMGYSLAGMRGSYLQ